MWSPAEEREREARRHAAAWRAVLQAFSYRNVTSTPHLRKAKAKRQRETRLVGGESWGEVSEESEYLMVGDRGCKLGLSDSKRGRQITIRCCLDHTDRGHQYPRNDTVHDGGIDAGRRRYRMSQPSRRSGAMACFSCSCKYFSRKGCGGEGHAPEEPNVRSLVLRSQDLAVKVRPVAAGGSSSCFAFIGLTSALSSHAKKWRVLTGQPANHGMV